jgi:microcompartment protein CcmK/EutM
LSKTVEGLHGARWLVVSPFTREHFPSNAKAPAVSKEPSLVVYDDLGGGVGQTIGFIEGREAAMPFDQPTPIDAIDAALIDTIFYSPFK